MDVREKLVKLVEYMDGVCPSGVSCYNCPHEEIGEGCSIQAKVDYLIKGGVTVQEWKPISEPPEEHDSIWAKLYGTKSWQPGLFRKCSYDVLACVEKKDGSRRVISIRTYDGKWDKNKLNEETVICWQSMPQPPKGELS